MTDLQTFLSSVRPPSTPALIVRREALLRNLRAMQLLCDAAGVRLRAHGKMHKCSTLGRLQVELGAVGLCCQTVGEAEAFAGGGIGDVLVTAPVPPWGAPRLAALARNGSRISAVADDEGQVERLNAAACDAGVTLNALVDVDLGQRRSGCRPEEAKALALAIAASPSLTFGGIQAYLGHLQHEPDLDVRRRAVEAATARLSTLVAELDRSSLHPDVVTGGGTGTHAIDLAGGIFTELQAGSYAVMDAEYEAAGAPDGGAWSFEPAMFIAATVVSSRHKTHCTTDAGLKAVAVDGPPARVVAGAAEGSAWRPMGDEHGAIFAPESLEAWEAAQTRLDRAELVERIDMDPDVRWPEEHPEVGNLVWLQPGHCDPTINLYDAMLVADEDGSLEAWPIDARRTTAAPR